MRNETITLCREELYQVTGFKLSGKQLKALAQMDIPFRVRPDGTPVVLRSTLQQPPATALEPMAKAKLNLI